jgi:hypothetical protein
MALVTLTQARKQCDITDDAHNELLQSKIEQASDIILDYLKAQANGEWTPQTAPGRVQAATLLMVAHLFEHRGDLMQPDEALWDAIGRILARSRDPALA